jgi:RHS repeat-associated protein
MMRSPALKLSRVPIWEPQSHQPCSAGRAERRRDANPLHFTGQQWDSESGLHYFPARHYSTQFRRFMSPDPTGIFLGKLNDPQSLNLYAYVRNNTPSRTDPSGLCDYFDGTCGGDIGISIGFGGGGWGGGDWGGGLMDLRISRPTSAQTPILPTALRPPTIRSAAKRMAFRMGCRFQTEVWLVCLVSKCRTLGYSASIPTRVDSRWTSSRSISTATPPAQSRLVSVSSTSEKPWRKLA